MSQTGNSGSEPPNRFEARSSVPYAARGPRYDLHPIKSQILVVGAGPAGIGAAVSASSTGKHVTLVDDNPNVGGQIWRGAGDHAPTPEARGWLDRLRESDVRIIPGTRVIAMSQAGSLLAESDDAAYELEFEKLILAIGARERFLPFPGWTLPGVVGAGGLQALVKSGLPIEGARVVIAGTGPLLLAVAAYLKARGARVVSIAEQAPLNRLLAFSVWLGRRHPLKAAHALMLRRAAGFRYLTGCWVLKATGDEKLTAVTLGTGSKTWEQACDYLACGFHLVPNVDLPALLGCDLRAGAVAVDKFQETTVPGIYCAGEPTGIGGLELSTVEGQIAGYAAAGSKDQARALFGVRRKYASFAAALDGAFKLRDELRSLPDPDTLVCRCEDVALGCLNQYDSWRSAKLQTRCGMGPCQGRICGPAAEFLLGWKVESVRPPIMPARIGTLALNLDRSDMN